MKKTRVFWLTFWGIVILQLFPFVLIGEWYQMVLYYIVFPFGELSKTRAFQILCAVIASSCVWSLIVTAIVTVVYSLLKRKQPRENEENNNANKT